MTGNLDFNHPNNNNHIRLKAPTSFSSNFEFTLPAAYGSNGQVLSTNGSGTLSWTDNGSGGGGSDVTAASNFTDNRMIKSGNSSKGVESTGIAVDDSNNMSGIGT